MLRRGRVGPSGCLAGDGGGRWEASSGPGGGGGGVWGGGGGAMGMRGGVGGGSLGWLVGCCGSGRLAPQMSTTGGSDSEHPTEAGSIDPRVATVCLTRRLSSVGRAIHS